MSTRSIWMLVFASVICVAVSICLLSFFNGYNVGHQEGYQAGAWDAAEMNPDCPAYPGAEQHPVEEWVCETEEDWAKLLMDCNEESNAAHVLMEIVGDQERELDRWRIQCTPRNAEQMKEIVRDTAEAVRNLAAKRAIERKNEED